MKFIVRFTFLLLLFAFTNCWAQEYNLAQKYFTIPIVKQKSFIALVRLRVNVAEKDSLNNFLYQLKVSTKGSTNPSEILSIKAYCNTDSNYLFEERIFQAAFFSSSTKSIADTLLLNGNLRLNPHTNFIWLGVVLKPSAEIGNKIELSVISTEINNHSIQVPFQKILQPSRITTAVRMFMQDNVHTSRIPGIATAKNGDLLATFDARYNSGRDLQGDIDIALCMSTDKGNTWLPLQRVIDMGTWGGLPEKFNGVSDASILVDDKTGVIFIAGLWMHGVLDDNGNWIEGLSDTSIVWNHQWRNKGSQPGFEPTQTAQFLLVKSMDNGKTWSSPINITKMCKREEWWLFAPAPGRGFTLDNGILVFPTQGRDKDGKPFSNITYSKDGGKTWESSEPAVSESTTECAGVQLSDGTIMLNMRTNANYGLVGNGNGRTVVTTADLGKTWHVHQTSRNALPEPVCMASLYKHQYLKNGKKKSVLLFVNPNSTVTRNNITLKVSFDDGNTWPSDKYILLDELNGAGYSCITSIDNDTIGIIYEGSQAQLIFQKINLKEIND